MAAYIVAIGLVVLNAFGTAVLWFEFRSRERRSIERVERLTSLLLDAIGELRRDIELAGGPPPAGGGAPPPPVSLPPAPAGLPLDQAKLTRDDHPTRPTVDAPPPADQDDGAAEEEVAAALRALYRAEAEEMDARDVGAHVTPAAASRPADVEEGAPTTHTAPPPAVETGDGINPAVRRR